MATETKICAFITQKGGAGKSVLTNIFCNELIFWHLQNRGEVISVLLVDIDPQKTNTAKRRQDVDYLNFQATTPEFQTLTLEQKTDVGRLQRRYACLLDAGFTTYNLRSVNLNENKQIDEALDMIKSGVYDYVFIDFPGSLTQSGTADFLQMVQHIFVPTSVNPSDVLGTESFLDTITQLRIKFKSINIVWNKFEPARIRKTDAITEQLGKKYQIPFLKTRVPYSPLNDCNTLIPASVNVNLNNESYSVAKPYLQDMAEEIITITQN